MTSSPSFFLLNREWRVILSAEGAKDLLLMPSAPPGLLQRFQNRREPPVPRRPQHVDLPGIRFLDRLNQVPLLLGFELLPLGELAPPAFEGSEQVLEDMIDPAVSGPKVIGEVRAGGGRAQRRSERHGALQVR